MQSSSTSTPARTVAAPPPYPTRARLASKKKRKPVDVSTTTAAGKPHTRPPYSTRQPFSQSWRTSSVHPSLDSLSDVTVTAAVPLTAPSTPMHSSTMPVTPPLALESRSASFSTLPTVPKPPSSAAMATAPFVPPRVSRRHHYHQRQLAHQSQYNYNHNHNQPPTHHNHNHHPQHHVHHHPHQNYHTANRHAHYARSASSTAAASAQSSGRGRRALNVVIVTTVAECHDATAKLSSYARIAVDCEGVALSRTGRLCLLQLASTEAVYIIDLIKTPVDDIEHGRALFEQGGLKSLLENPDVCKVMHDCRHDSDALFHQFGVTLGPVVDTQVVFGVLRRVRGMEEGLPVSLKTLLKKFSFANEDELDLKSSVKESMKGDDQFWLKRPLSDQALRYARFDVEHLLDVTLLLARLINSADKAGWQTVVSESQRYLAVFRDDEHGPRKAQQQYEQKARVARRQRVVWEQTKKVNLHRRSDPMRMFSFDHNLIVHSLTS